MPRQFNVDAARSTFELPPLTRQQIHALMAYLDASALDVIIMAVAQLWQREIGEPERDALAELDALKERLTAFETETRRLMAEQWDVGDLPALLEE